MDRRRPSYASVAGGVTGPGSSLRRGGSGDGALAGAGLAHPNSSNHNSAISDGADDAAGPASIRHAAAGSSSQAAGWLGKAGTTGAGGGGQGAWSDGALGGSGSASGGPAYFGGDGRGAAPDQLPLRPSHLRTTRYMERLEAARRAKAAALLALQQHHMQLQQQRDAAPGGGVYGGGSNGATALSASSSSASLQKMAPSHRGMTYEIVESSPPPEEEAVPALPACWKEKDRTGCIEISGDGLELRCSSAMKPQDHEAAAARTDQPMPPQCGIYYFEVAVLAKAKEGMVAIGFSCNKVSLERLPGWESESWAYHGDDGKSYCCQSAGKTYGPSFSTGDIVGCGVNFRNNTAFFTKNGIDLGVAFRDVRSQKLYPIVGMKRAGTHVKVNFGQAPFMFDIDGKMEFERQKIRDEIKEQGVEPLYSSKDESALLKDLVRQLLRHDGYVKTAEAFAEETRAESQALYNKPLDGSQTTAIRHDPDAIHRQQIRAAVLDGDIDKAIKLTSTYYSHVLPENPDIEFRLRCRKFVEMMRQSHEPVAKLRERGVAPASNGHSSEQDMELDEPAQDTPDDSDNMDTEEAVMVSRSPADRMREAMEYGTVLGQTYKDDVSTVEPLKQIFSLFAYQDIKNSPAAPIMDVSGRAAVSEELNSAILVSLGKSSAAAIEKIYRQTEVLLDHYLNDQGGPGAFVNINYDVRR